MKRYTQLHVWMVGILLLVQIGIFRFYWPSFETKSWEFHIHYWLVTAWYLLLIFQPFWATHGKLERHRTIGLLGFMIAGGAIFTAISLLDFPLKMVERWTPESKGPPIPFYYGTLVIELVLILAFAYAVVMGILRRRQVEEHAWWLTASAFFMMMPAVGRGMIVFWRSILPPEKLNPMFIAISAEVIYIPLLLIFALKFGKIKHPATYLALMMVLVRFLRLPIGKSEWIQQFLKTLIQTS